MKRLARAGLRVAATRLIFLKINISRLYAAKPTWYPFIDKIKEFVVYNQLVINFISNLWRNNCYSIV
jgi:hypothetical protein